MGPNAQDAAARAKQLVSERKYQDAVRACRRLLLSKPDHVDVRVLLGQALLALGRHDEVRIEMQALLKKAPLVAPAHRLLGEAYLRARQSDNAASALREALRLDPEDEEARELLEELGEVEDEMPPMETIERWFPDEPTRVEAAETPDAPATSPATDAPPSVELSDDLRAEITRTNEAKAPPPRAPKKTLMGLAIPAPPKVRGPLPSPTSPAIVSPPKPSVPPPPPGRSMPSAPPPPSSSSGSVVAPPPVRPPRAVKSTLLGFSAVPAPVPAPTPRPIPSPAPAPTSAPSLASADLISADSEELLSAELLAPSTGDLDLAELTTGSAELERLVPKVRPDPYEHLAQEPPPLEGEATDARRPLGEDDLEEDEELPGEPTRARPPVLDGVSDEQDLFGAGLPELEAEPTRARAPVDFEDETTKGREESAVDVATTTRAAAVDDGATSQRPRVEGFPSDALPIDGLPELAGEPTLARPTPEGPQPAGFSPSAAPGGFSPSAAPGGFSPSAAPGGAPSGFAPSAMPSSFAPSAMPGSAAGVLPGSTPSSTSTERPSAKLPSSGSGNVASGEAFGSGDALSSGEAVAGGTRLVRIARWTLPLPTAIALAGVPVLVVVLVVFGVRTWLAGRAEDAIAEATVAAQRDGLAASLRRALELDADEGSDEGPAVARRARLYATAAYDHGFEESDRARTLLESLDDEARGSQEAHVAATYLALEAGEIEPATERSMLLDGAALDGEAGLARARLAFVRGELERAETEMRAALARAPDAPRFVAWMARILSARAKADEALTALGALTVRSPDVSLAHAEASLEAGRPSDALDTLLAMESELASATSRRQLVQRGRLRMLALLAAGRLDEARDQLQVSLTDRPVGDEAFGLDLVRVQLALGDVEGARATLAALPPAPARRVGRALLTAEAQLAAGDFDAAERSLEDAGDSARASFLRGRVAEARGRTEDAIAHYRTAAQVPRERVRATARLGALALDAGNEAEAIGLLEPLLPEAATDAEIVSTLARAYLEADRGDDAARIVTAALTARPDALDLQLTKAEIDLARGDSAGALAVMQQVISRAEQSARAQGMLGEAARREGQTTLATEAFDRALALDARQPLALLGKVYLALDAAEPTEADAALTRAREQGAVGRALATVLEGRVQVAQGLGARAARTLARSVRRTRDAALLTDYGWALAQSEDDRGAIRQFERAIEIDGGLVEAYLGLALSRTRRGDLGGASQAIGEAEGLVQRRSLGARYEARLLAARGRVLYENGSFDEAEAKAREALAKDASCAAAHYVLGIVADARGGSPVEHLRAALAARAPLPEVMGQLVLFDGRADDVCDLARRYLEAAPRGLDARDARSTARRCR